MVGHCRDTLQLSTAGILCSWALQGYSAVGQCRDTWWLGNAGILGGWSLKSASSRARTTSTLKSNNPTARVGNKSRSMHADTRNLPDNPCASLRFGYCLWLVFLQVTEYSCGDSPRAPFFVLDCPSPIFGIDILLTSRAR